MNEDLKKALVDVRKSYRLIYQYIKSTLDTVEWIGMQFNARFYRWQPYQYEITPQRNTNPFERSKWDMLPFYKTTFLFVSEKVDINQKKKKGDWLLEIYIDTDDAYDYHDENPNPSTFKDPYASNSDLFLQLYYCTSNSDFDWFNFYNKSEYEDYGENTVFEVANYNFIKSLYQKHKLYEIYDRNTLSKKIESFKKVVYKKTKIVL